MTSEETNLEPVPTTSTVAVPTRRRGRPRKTETVRPDMLPLTLGMALQQARQARHMKLPSIAKKLKIKEVYLDALERGHYYRFPALVYGIGFLRTYATFLGLDADDMVARFHRETTDILSDPIDIPHNADPHLIPPVKTIVKSIIGLFLLYLIWNVYKIMTHNPFPEIEMPTVETTVKTKADTVKAPLTPDELPMPTLQEEPAVKTKPLPPPLPKRTPKVYGLKKAARVSFVATGKTWIEIRDTEEDSILLTQTMETGDRYNPDEDSEGLVLKTTNAGGLDIYIDGKKVRTLGRAGQTKAGIQMDAASLMKD